MERLPQAQTVLIFGEGPARPAYSPSESACACGEGSESFTWLETPEVARENCQFGRGLSDPIQNDTPNISDPHKAVDRRLCSQHRDAHQLVPVRRGYRHWHHQDTEAAVSDGLPNTLPDQRKRWVCVDDLPVMLTAEWAQGLSPVWN